MKKKFLTATIAGMMITQMALPGLSAFGQQINSMNHSKEVINKDNGVGVDKSVLKAEVIKAIKILEGNEDRYTKDTVITLVEAIHEGNEILNLQVYKTQQQINEATQNIENAIKGLVVDKSELKAEIAKGQNVLKDSKGYTQDTIKTLQNAVNAGEQVISNKDATIDVVSEATQNIENAIKGLVIDKSGLKAEITKGQNALKDSTGYIQDTVKVLQDAVNAGQQVISNKDATIDRVNKATQNIKNALKGLITINKNNREIKFLGLGETQYADLQINYNTNKIILKTYPVQPHVYFKEEAYETVIIRDSSEKVIYQKDFIGEKQYTESLKEINMEPGYSIEFISKEPSRVHMFNSQGKPDLEYGKFSENVILLITKSGVTVDKSGLEAEITKGQNALKGSKGYTQDTVKALQNAVNAGEQVISNKDATIDAVNGATQNIANAIKALMIDKSGLEAEITKGQNALKDSKGYTDVSVKNLKNAIIAGQTVAKNANATVEQIQNVIDNINNAIKGLVKVNQGKIEGKIVDTNGTGIAGVKVSLYDVNTGTLIKTVESNKDGIYDFTGLANKNYYAKVVFPKGYKIVKSNVFGGNGESGWIKLDNTNLVDNLSLTLENKTIK